MKIKTGRIAALLSVASLCFALAACGGGQDNRGGGTTTPSEPTTVVTARGSLATDSWGYTGVSAAQLTAPAGTAVAIEGHTLLEDAQHAVVSGSNPTVISYSSDITTLPAAGRVAAPGTFVSYLNTGVGAARSAQPALAATVDVGVASAGQTVNVYRYDSGTGTWVSPQAAVVSSTGQATYTIGVFGLYGIFK